MENLYSFLSDPDVSCYDATNKVIFLKDQQYHQFLIKSSRKTFVAKPFHKIGCKLCERCFLQIVKFSYQPLGRVAAVVRASPRNPILKCVKIIIYHKISLNKIVMT